MTATLQNGQTIPLIGLGTWRSPSSVMLDVIKNAIDLGYRHFDCAHIYGNEVEIGTAIQEKIKEGKVRRDELFITSKLWNTYHNPDRVQSACVTSLKNLKINYLDLYLMHWPMGYKDGDEPYPKNSKGKILYSDYDFIDTWKAMEALVDLNICKSIGLSNFSKSQIDRILKNCTIRPQVLQVESHPYLSQEELIEYCRNNDIVFTAYSPLGSAHTPYKKPGDYPVLENPVVKNIAERLNSNVAQVLLRFQIQRGNVVIPRSVDKQHLASNFDINSITLTDEDMESLKSLNMGEDGRIVRMDVCEDHPFYPFIKHEETSTDSQ